MEQTVYLDIFFLINFSMDFLCFFLTSKLLSVRFALKRVVPAAVFGGIYACASLFLYATGVAALVMDLLVCGIMCAIAILRRKNFREVLGFSVVYAAVSVVLGGVMTALFSVFNKIGIDKLLGDEGDADGISVWFFLFLAIISGMVAVFGGKFFKKKSSRREGILKIVYGPEELSLKGLCDSGNLLTDPLSAKPCIIVERAEMERILPKRMVDLLRCGRLELLDSEHARRVRVVPTHTVSGSVMLYAIRADYVAVDLGKGWRELDALVALGSIGDSADGAKALIPSSLAFGIK